jgi:copper(I)-binding protein
MAPTEEMEPGLHVRDAWTRESPMMDLAGAAYMVIHNSTDADDALVAVSSPAAEVVELHLSSMDDEGMMAMNQVTEIPIPAHADAVLEPGSYHVMLIDLVEPLTEGVEVELDLEFMTAERQTIVAPVMASAPMTGDMDTDMDDMSHDDDMDEDDMSHDDDMDEDDEEDEG